MSPKEGRQERWLYVCGKVWMNKWKQWKTGYSDVPMVIYILNPKEGKEEK